MIDILKDSLYVDYSSWMFTSIAGILVPNGDPCLAGVIMDAVRL